ncbi:MAG TPA: hypothetical protein VF028_05305 [Actinomycetota bacterium]|nr:hypothetical protein [Actinomycetota bacterium]
MRARTAALGLAAASILVLALPALGGTTSLEDPNDTNGRLDVRNVTLDDAVSPLAWRIETFRRWTVRDIWDRGFVTVQLDTKGDARIDHLAVVGSNGRALIGVLNRVRSDGRLVEIGRLHAGMAGGRAVALTIALHRLSIGPYRTSFSWNVVTSFLGDNCPRTCFDVVPDEGMVEQPLPGPSPSPTGPTGPSG